MKTKALWEYNSSPQLFSTTQGVRENKRKETSLFSRFLLLILLLLGVCGNAWAEEVKSVSGNVTTWNFANMSADHFSTGTTTWGDLSSNYYYYKKNTSGNSVVVYKDDEETTLFAPLEGLKISTTGSSQARFYANRSGIYSNGGGFYIYIPTNVGTTVVVTAKTAETSNKMSLVGADETEITLSGTDNDYTFTATGTEIKMQVPNKATITKLVVTEAKNNLTAVRLMGNQNADLFLLKPGEVSTPAIILEGSDNSNVTEGDFNLVSSDPDVATVAFRLQDGSVKNRIFLTITAGTKTGTTTITPNFLGNETLNAKAGTSFTITVAPTVTLTYAMGTGGSALTAVSSNREATVYASGSDFAAGRSVKFTATPAEWFLFDNWHDGTNYVGEGQNPYITTVDANLNLTANFIRGYKFATAVNDANMGSAKMTYSDGTEFNSDVLVGKNTAIKAVATPKTGYKLARWEYNSTQKSTNATYEITKAGDVDASTESLITLTAIFEADAAPATPSDLKTKNGLKSNKNVWTPAVGGTLDLTNVLSTSSTGAYSITCDPADCATLDGTTLTAVAAGTVTINQAADATYEAGSVDITIQIVGNKSNLETNEYTVDVNDKVNDGTTIARKNITMTYGEDGFWGVGAADSHGRYIASQTNPTVSGNIATAGTFYKFHADRAGTLAIDVKCNSSRNLYFATSEAQLTGKDDEGNTVGNGSRFSELYLGNLTFDIEANTDYYLYAKSTKLAVYGFTFAPDVQITFAAGEGSGTMPAQFVKNGVPTTLNANTLTAPAGEVFNYWSSTTGATYGDEASIIATEDITLTANWKVEDNKHDVALVAFSVTSADKLLKNTEYSAPEGTVILSNDKTPASKGIGYAVKLDGDSQYIQAKLPEGYTFQAGDKIIVTGCADGGGTQGIKLGDTSSKDNATILLQSESSYKAGNLWSQTYDVTGSDILNGDGSVYVFRTNSFYVSSITIIRTVDNQASSSEITVAFDKEAATTLNLTDKVKVTTTNADEMYVYWDNQTDADDAKFTAATKHQINPYYTTPATTGNVYLHVKAVNLASGLSNTVTRNYKIYATPTITVDNLIISAQSGATAPKATVTYFNGVETVTVPSPNVTYTWKAESSHIENPNGGTTITGLTQGKATVVAHYAANDALCLNAAADVEFTVSVNLHLYFVADFGLGKIKDATDEKANGRVYKNGYVTAEKGDTDIEFPTFTLKNRADELMTESTDYTISGPTLQEGSDDYVVTIIGSTVTVNTDKPGCAMLKYVVTPTSTHTAKGYETTNIYVPIMIEETDESKYCALEGGKHYRPLEKFEVDGCTMTLGGWNGYYEDGKALNPDANYKDESTDSKDNVSGVTYPYTKDGKTTYPSDSWSTSGSIKSTISQKFVYAAAGTKNNNPRNENAVNPYTEHAGSGTYVRSDYPAGTPAEKDYGEYDMFSVPCRGAYVTFEPKADGYVTLHVNQKTVLDDESIGKKNSETGKTGKWGTFGNGRFFQIRDERGMFVEPLSYCSNTSNINTPRFGNFIKSGDLYESSKTDDEIITKEYLEQYYGVSQSEYELNQVLKITKDKETSIKSPNFITLYEGPVTYRFNVKAGKTYYAYVAVSKFDVCGFEFHEEAPAPTVVTLDDATGHINGSAATVGTVTNMASVTYNRSMNADTWYPVVLPYSMNAKQVKYVFGNNESTWENSAEIIYFDHIADGTIYFMSHFYKTIVAGVPCLVRPSKNVSSLSLAGCEYPYVTVETPETKTIPAGADDYNWVSSYGAQTIDNGDYYFSIDKDHNIKQMTSPDSAPLKGFRALLKAPSPSGAKIYNVALTSYDEDGNMFESGVDGIDFIIVDREGNMNIATNNNVYNINGQLVRVGTADTTGLAEGIYVVNGKKVFVK